MKKNNEYKESFLAKYKGLIIFGLVVILLCVFYIYKSNSKNIDIYDRIPTYPDIKYTSYQYQPNEYKIETVGKNGYINDYYQEFLYLLFNNIEEAWNYLSKSYKEDKFDNNYDNFKKYIEGISTVYTSSNQIKALRIENDLNKNKYHVIDSEDIYMVFIEDGIWNIEVELIDKVELDY